MLSTRFPNPFFPKQMIYEKMCVLRSAEHTLEQIKMRRKKKLVVRRTDDDLWPNFIKSH